MNTLSEIKTKILKSSHINEIENLISLRAFLFDKENMPWALLSDFSQLNEIIENFNNNENKFYISKNIKNIKKLDLNISSLQMMPKNKKLVLIDFIDDIIKNNIDDIYLIEDPVRINPFVEDKLFNLIKLHKKNININHFTIYKKRNDDLLNLKSILVFDKKNYDSCIDLAYIFKIKNIWNNLWSDKKKYSIDYDSTVENIIL